MTRAARVVLAFAVFASAGPAASAQPTPDLDPRIVQLAGQVSQDRLVAILKKLESFGTRNVRLRLELKGRTWVRFEIWDIAANGAFTQPVWLVGGKAN